MRWCAHTLSDVNMPVSYVTVRFTFLDLGKKKERGVACIDCVTLKSGLAT